MRLPSWLVVGLAGLLLASCQSAPAAPAGVAPSSGATTTGGSPSSTSGAAPVASAPVQRKALNLAFVAPSETMSVPWVAKDAGFFDKQGLDVTLHLVPGTPRLVQSLIAGDFDYGQVGGAGPMAARLEGADTVILASTGDYFNFRLMASAASGARTMQDLRGKTIAVSQIGSTSHTFVRVLLGQANMTLDDVFILQAGGNPAAAQALISGGVDAATANGVWVPPVQAAGGVTIADGKALKIPAIGAVLTATERHIARDRDEALRVLRAYVEAIHYYKTNPTETKAIMQKYMNDLPMDQVTLLFDDVQDDLQPIPYPSAEVIDVTLERDFNQPPGAHKATDFYDASLLQEIERSGFLQTLSP